MASSRKTDPVKTALVTWLDRYDPNGYLRLPQRSATVGSPVFGIALSGGVDSMALFQALTELAPVYAFSLLAIHINHGLHPLADHWERFCRHEANLRAIPFLGIKIKVQAKGEGIEAAARERRYAALASAPVDGIFLAHHEDDQAETLLIRLCRGSGLLGLAAMQPIIRHNNMFFFRPLLNVSKKTIEDYTEDKNLNFIQDPSNHERRFARNLIRHDVMPVLRSHYPNATATLARAARHLKESQDLLDELAALDAQNIMDLQERIDIQALLALGHARATNFLRFFLRQKGLLPIQEKQMEAILQSLKAPADRDFLFDFGAVSLRRSGHFLVLAPCIQTEPFCLNWQGESKIQLKNGCLFFTETTGFGLSLGKLASFPLIIRSRQGGEKILLKKERPRQKIKELLRQNGVPAFLRDMYPLVFAGDTLVAIPHIAIAEDWQAKQDEKGLCIYFDYG